jgi:hypothetical protein
LQDMLGREEYIGYINAGGVGTEGLGRVLRYEKVQGNKVLTGGQSGGWWSWSRGTPA